MSTKLETIKDSGRGKVDLDITRFWGGKESIRRQSPARKFTMDNKKIWKSYN